MNIFLLGAGKDHLRSWEKLREKLCYEKYDNYLDYMGKTIHLMDGKTSKIKSNPFLFMDWR